MLFCLACTTVMLQSMAFGANEVKEWNKSLQRNREDTVNLTKLLEAGAYEKAIFLLARKANDSARNLKDKTGWDFALKTLKAKCLSSGDVALYCQILKALVEQNAAFSAYPEDVQRLLKIRLAGALLLLNQPVRALEIVETVTKPPYKLEGKRLAPLCERLLWFDKIPAVLKRELTQVPQTNMPAELLRDVASYLNPERAIELVQQQKQDFLSRKRLAVADQLVADGEYIQLEMLINDTESGVGNYLKGRFFYEAEHFEQAAKYLKNCRHAYDMGFRAWQKAMHLYVRALPLISKEAFRKARFREHGSYDAEADPPFEQHISRYLQRVYLEELHHNGSIIHEALFLNVAKRFLELDRRLAALADTSDQNREDATGNTTPEAEAPPVLRLFPRDELDLALAEFRPEALNRTAAVLEEVLEYQTSDNQKSWMYYVRTLCTGSSVKELIVELVEALPDLDALSPSEFAKRVIAGQSYSEKVIFEFADFTANLDMPRFREAVYESLLNAEPSTGMYAAAAHLRLGQLLVENQAFESAVEHFRQGFKGLGLQVEPFAVSDQAEQAVWDAEMRAHYVLSPDIESFVRRIEQQLSSLGRKRAFVRLVAEERLIDLKPHLEQMASNACPLLKSDIEKAIFRLNVPQDQQQYVEQEVIGDQLRYPEKRATLENAQRDEQIIEHFKDQFPELADLEEDEGASEYASFIHHDPIDKSVTWVVLKSDDLARVEHGTRQVQRQSDVSKLWGQPGMQPHFMTFDQYTVWVANDQGLFAYDRRAAQWVRYAIPGFEVEDTITAIEAGEKELKVTFCDHETEQRVDIALVYASGTWEKAE
jgi:predicted negative regulator of RcsB-dependent stress response